MVLGLWVAVLATAVGLAVSAVLVPRALATSRGLANLLAVASVLLWPFALTYTLDWFGLGGL
jgi:hypothetical protein